MEDDCEDIYTNGLIKRYTMRTSSLENVTLADWAAWYDMCGKPYVKQSNELDVDNLLSETCNDDDYIDDDDDDDDDGDDDKSSKKVILAKTKKRTKARIIRSCWFSKEAEPEKYYRENYNLSDDIGIPSVDSNTEPLILNEMQDDEYRRMVQMLNREQKEFFYHVLHLTKTSDEPFYCFLSGGAGVGKSHLTKALYQAALKYYNTRAGENFAEVNVLMLAPTGKAAYNIKGNTIHSALAIPACQSLKNYKSLDSSKLNTLRCQIGGVKLIFLDEISMVGNTMFTVQIDNRLKDVKGSALPFGGVSIIAIGDLFQLQPVMNGYIFKDMDNSEYSILAQNLWQEHFQMFELQEIMRQRESKEFANMLSRLREGKHSKEDIIKFKGRLIQSNNRN